MSPGAALATNNFVVSPLVPIYYNTANVKWIGEAFLRHQVVPMLHIPHARKKISLYTFFVWTSLIVHAGCQRFVLEDLSSAERESKDRFAVLAWAECVEFTKRDHPDLKAAEEVRSQAKLQWQRALEGFLPRVSGSFDRKRKKTGSEGPIDQLTLAVSGSEEWFSGFENSGEILRAKRTYKAETHNFRDVESAVAFSLRSAFVGLLHAQELVLLRRSITERRKLNGDIVRLRYEAGREHRGSLKRAEAIYDEAEFDVREAERKIRVEQAGLGRELGGRYDITLAVSGQLALMIPAKPVAEPDITALAENVPSVERRKALLDASGASVIKEQAAFWPTVAGSMNYSRTGKNYLMDTESWDAGFKVNVPFFSGGENWADVRSARSDQREAHFVLRDTRDNAYTDLIEKWTSLIGALENVDVRHKFLEAATERVEITRIQYQDGLVSFVDWDSVEQELVNSRISLLNAERDAITAEADWIRSQGLSFDAYRS